MKTKTTAVFFRVTDTEKILIKSKADKCGISISEYLRKRALGYAPKALLPDNFYEFNEKLGKLYDACGENKDYELQKKVLSLIDAIHLKLLSSDKE